MQILLIGFNLLLFNYSFLISAQISSKEKEQPEDFFLSPSLSLCCDRNSLHDANNLISCANTSAHFQELQLFSRIQSSLVGALRLSDTFI